MLERVPVWLRGVGAVSGLGRRVWARAALRCRWTGGAGPSAGCWCRQSAGQGRWGDLQPKGAWAGVLVRMGVAERAPARGVTDEGPGCRVLDRGPVCGVGETEQGPAGGGDWSRVGDFNPLVCPHGLRQGLRDHPFPVTYKGGCLPAGARYGRG